MQQIARAELERARLDVRGEALRKAAARLEELASGASLALTAADASLMQIDRDYTKLHAEVRGWKQPSASPDNRIVCQLQMIRTHKSACLAGTSYRVIAEG